MSNANLPEEPYENPFEAPRTYGFGENDGGSDRFGNQGSDDDSHQMPPVEQSYWTGFLLFGLWSLATCVIPSLRFPVWSVASGPAFTVFLLMVWFSSFLILFLPLCLIRLGLHRYSISKAIDAQTYPGTQRFGFEYLIKSLMLSAVSVFGGGLMFFGICTGFLILSDNGGLPMVSEWVFLPLLTIDGLVSLMVTGFLLNLSVPQYRS
jgi:hypothetical protein